jgi:hypothetical protein
MPGGPGNPAQLHHALNRHSATGLHFFLDLPVNRGFPVTACSIRCSSDQRRRRSASLSADKAGPSPSPEADAASTPSKNRSTANLPCRFERDLSGRWGNLLARRNNAYRFARFFAARIAAKPGRRDLHRSHEHSRARRRTCRPSDAVCLPESSKSQGVIERNDMDRSVRRVRGSDGSRCQAARLRRPSGIPICYTEKTRRPEHGTDRVEVPYGYALGGLPADG